MVHLPVAQEVVTWLHDAARGAGLDDEHLKALTSETQHKGFPKTFAAVHGMSIAQRMQCFKQFPMAAFLGLFVSNNGMAQQLRHPQ